MGRVSNPPLQQQASRVGQRDDGALVRAVRRFADQRAAVTVAGGDETRGHVAAQQGDVGHVHTVADRERAAGMIRISGIAQGRARAEADAGEVDGVLPVQASHGP